jgi:hypothetical protein
VRLYDRDRDLLTTVTGHVADTLLAGGTCVLIMTAEHRAGLHWRIAPLRAAEARAQGRLVELDAAATLRRFMRSGSPDPDLFDDVVGTAVRRCIDTGSPVYAFGEMVNLLWWAGNSAAALRLEELWGELQLTAPFRLLCGYASAGMQQSDRAALCAAHDRVLA